MVDSQPGRMDETVRRKGQWIIGNVQAAKVRQGQDSWGVSQAERGSPRAIPQPLDEMPSLLL